MTNKWMIEEAIAYLDYLRDKSGNTIEYYMEFERMGKQINNNPYRLCYENGKHVYRRYTAEEMGVVYAEEYGIIEYHIADNKMIYYVSYPYERTTYKAVINLDTSKETRQAMRYYYKPYKSLIGGKYQANWG